MSYRNSLGLSFLKYKVGITTMTLVGQSFRVISIPFSELPLLDLLMGTRARMSCAVMFRAIGSVVHQEPECTDSGWVLAVREVLDNI